jgi:hypothetical protein
MSFPQIRMGIDPKEPENAFIVDCSEMRRRIFEASHESALVRQAMNAADYNGMNAEDRYTLLAYHSLVALETYYKRCLEMTRLYPMQPMVLKDPK